MTTSYALTVFSRASRRASFLAAALGFLTLLTTGVTYAVQTTDKEFNSLYAGLGAKGYDVVAYFADGRPMMGSEKHTAQYGGVTWRFATKENRDKFAADPDKYAPQYGGYCSWGVAQGKLFDVDPVNGWKVVDGKLYLNFNADIQEVWEGDAGGFIAKANRNWPGLNQ